jgi:hypothetical protein
MDSQASFHSVRSDLVVLGDNASGRVSDYSAVDERTVPPDVVSSADEVAPEVARKIAHALRVGSVGRLTPDQFRKHDDIRSADHVPVAFCKPGDIVEVLLTIFSTTRQLGEDNVHQCGGLVPASNVLAQSRSLELRRER